MKVCKKYLKEAILAGLNLAMISKKFNLPNSTSSKRLVIKYGLLDLWSKDYIIQKRLKETKKRYVSSKCAVKIENERKRLILASDIQRLISDKRSKRDILKILKISPSTFYRIIRTYIPNVDTYYKENVENVGQGLKSTVGQEFINSLNSKQIKQLITHWKMWKAKKAACRSCRIKFDVPFVLLKFPKFCPVTGVKLIYSRGKLTDNKATLDKVDPNKHYTLDNVCIISYKANRLKNNSNLSELKQLINYIENFNKNKPRFYFNRTLVMWRKLKRLEDSYGNTAIYSKITYHNNYPRDIS